MSTLRTTKSMGTSYDCCLKNNFDTILRGGDVIDGSGTPAFRADIGIRGDRIVDVGNLSNASADVSVDVSGLSVVPGFIDAHSHSDAYLLIEPTSPSKLSQGITTEIVGQCGASAAPLCGSARLPSDWASQKYPGKWTSFAEYRNMIEAVHTSVNVMALAGHRNLRMSVMGMAPRPATSDEIASMKDALEAAMDQGASGISTGLLYEPSNHSESGEIIALASIAAKHGGFYATHLRSESVKFIEALEESIRLCRESGASLQVSHIKTSGKANWSKVDKAIELIEKARAEGLTVNADRYPYLAAGTDLDILLPSWAVSKGHDAELTRIKDSSIRNKIIEEMNSSHDEEYWKTVMIGGTWAPETEHFRGRYLSDAAAELHLTPSEALLHIVELDDLRTGGFFFGMCKENLAKFLARPWVMIGSDASLRSITGPLSHDHPHPRAYGSHSAMLEAARNGKYMSLPEAVRRMTSLPADSFGIHNRGRITPGYFADITVFNAASVRAVSTYAEPHKFAEGISRVFVNGKEAYSSGIFHSIRPGRWLKAELQ